MLVRHLIDQISIYLRSAYLSGQLFILPTNAVCSYLYDFDYAVILTIPHDNNMIPIFQWINSNLTAYSVIWDLYFLFRIYLLTVDWRRLSRG